jgi:hypothetical protein
MSDKDSIFVTVADTTAIRGYTPRELKVEVLAENVSLFLTQIESMLDKAPDDVGNFEFTEFTVSAEITAKGGLVLLGTGVETAAKGGLAFKFQRKA